MSNYTLCAKLHTVCRSTHFFVCAKLYTFCKITHLMQYQNSFFHEPILKFYTLLKLFLTNMRNAHELTFSFLILINKFSFQMHGLFKVGVLTRMGFYLVLVHTYLQSCDKYLNLKNRRVIWNNQWALPWSHASLCFHFQKQVGTWQQETCFAI